MAAGLDQRSATGPLAAVRSGRYGRPVCRRNRLKGETDEAARRARYSEAQRILAENAANVFLFRLARTGVQRKGLKGCG